MDKQKEVKKLLEHIREIIGGGAYVFRGESNIKNGDVSSSLYRSYKKICKEEGLPGLPEGLTAREMQVLVEENICEYTDTAGLDVLTELQHYGGHTNRIDFTRDYFIALFFACNGDFAEDGRFLLLRKDYAELKEPRKNQNNRVIFQRSVFVEIDGGYIPKKECLVISVSKHLKTPLLDYLKQYHNIGMETIYGDLPGYIDNQERYQKAHIYFRAGINRAKKKEYAAAIRAYGKAVELKQNYTEAYYNRGLAGYFISANEPAIGDFEKVIELNPGFVAPHFLLGRIKKFLEKREEAKAHFQTALKWELKKETPGKNIVAAIKKELANLA